MIAPLLACGVLQLQVNNARFARPGHKFIVIAHRGNHVSAPENTLDALEEAVRVGADFMEIDLRTTADGEIILMHDGDVKRMTSGNEKVRKLTFRDIRALKIKGARHADEKVPTFDEILAAAKGRINLYMDIKDVTPAQVKPHLERFGMMRNVIAYVYSGSQVDEWTKGFDGRIPIIADVDFKKGVEQLEKNWSKHPFAITDGNALRYSKDSIDAFHRLGVLVWPDIQNPGESPAQWQPVIDLGVDGFQTDHPEALIKYLNEKGIR